MPRFRVPGVTPSFLSTAGPTQIRNSEFENFANLKIQNFGYNLAEILKDDRPCGNSQRRSTLRRFSKMPALPDPQHEHFCQIYAVSRHAKKAAREAGLPPFYSKNPTPFLQRPHIQARIREILGIAMANADITPERVMRELSRVAFSDVRDLYDEHGELLPVHELDDDTAATVAGIDVEVHMEGRGDEARPVTIRKIRRVDKMSALGLLAKHFKIVGDEGDGVSALASALADRLNSAKRRMNEGDVEDAVVRPRGVLEHQPAEPLDWPPPPAADDLAPAPAPASTIIPAPSKETEDDEPWG